jgi:hypothetical protein
MSKYLVCPYCEEEIHEVHDYVDNQSTECSNCEKTFYFEIEYEPICNSWTEEEQLNTELKNATQNIEYYEKEIRKATELGEEELRERNTHHLARCQKQYDKVSSRIEELIKRKL